MGPLAVTVPLLKVSKAEGVPKKSNGVVLSENANAKVSTHGVLPHAPRAAAVMVTVPVTW